MLDFTKLRSSIKDAFGEEITPEQAERLGKINGVIDSMEEENKVFIEKHEQLRTKYIDVIKDVSFTEKPVQETEENTPKTLAECLEEVSKKK